MMRKPPPAATRAKKRENIKEVKPTAKKRLPKIYKLTPFNNFSNLI